MRGVKSTTGGRLGPTIGLKKKKPSLTLEGLETRAWFNETEVMPVGSMDFAGPQAPSS